MCQGHSFPSSEAVPPKGQPGGQPGYIYEWVAEHLAARIECGELPVHTAIPNERQLAREYNVSLGTARHATRLLRERGLVVTVKAKGTYVVARAAYRGRT
jgi:DNA-binding GntR family transcriptional regulator